MVDKINEKSPAWQRKEGKNPSGGLNAKGVASYRAANPGSKLKTAVTTKPSKLKKGSKAAKRRKSFCARMKGMKKKLTSAKTAGDKDSRINKSLRKWNCSTELPIMDRISESIINNIELLLEGKKPKNRGAVGSRAAVNRNKHLRNKKAEQRGRDKAAGKGAAEEGSIAAKPLPTNVPILVPTASDQSAPNPTDSSPKPDVNDTSAEINNSKEEAEKEAEKGSTENKPKPRVKPVAPKMDRQGGFLKGLVSGFSSGSNPLSRMTAFGNDAYKAFKQDQYAKNYNQYVDDYAVYTAEKKAAKDQKKADQEAREKARKDKLAYDQEEIEVEDRGIMGEPIIKKMKRGEATKKGLTPINTSTELFGNKIIERFSALLVNNVKGNSMKNKNLGIIESRIVHGFAKLLDSKLNELSKETYQNYAKKAAAQYDSGKTPDNKALKRIKGIGKAERRVVKHKQGYGEKGSGGAHNSNSSPDKDPTVKPLTSKEAGGARANKVARVEKGKVVLK